MYPLRVTERSVLRLKREDNILIKRFTMTVAAMMLLTAMPSSAAIIRLFGQNYDVGGDTRWQSDVDYGGPAQLAVDKGFAGAYNVTIDGGRVVQAFCIDLFLGIQAGSPSNPSQYTENLVSPTSNTLADMTRVSRAAWIFSDVFPNIAALAASNRTNAATVAVALQFALWETMIDDTRSLTSGFFQQTAPPQGAAGSNVDYDLATLLASIMLGTHTGPVNTTIANYSTILVATSFNLRDPTNTTNIQRMIVFNGVPEPGTMVLFGSALTALGLIARRRKA